MSARPPAAEAAVGAFAAFSNPGYPFFWLASVASSMGVGMQTVIGEWQVYNLTGSALHLGLVGLMSVLPLITFGIFGGAFADAVDRRKLVVASQALRILTVLTLGVLTLTGQIDVWHIYAGTLVGSFAGAFDQPARQAMIFSMVPRHHLMNAVTWHNVQRDASRLAGPSLAGLVMAFVSIHAAYFVTWLLFLPLVVAMTRVQISPPPEKRAPAGELLLDGMRFLRNTPVVYTSLTLDFCLSFFGGYRGMLALYAKDILGVGAEGFGILSSAVAAGGILGSTFVLRLGESQRKGQLQLAAMGLYAVGLIGFGLSAFLPLSLLLAAVLGFCDTVAGVMRRSLIQLSTPDGMQGRVGAVQAMVASSGPPLGSAQAGALASVIGAPFALALGGSVCGVAAIIAVFRSRTFRSA
jgi:MFS family permease